MNEKIQTAIMFAVPIGVTTIDKDICGVLKELNGCTQHQQELPNCRILENHPQIVKAITDVFTIWVNNTFVRQNQQYRMTTSWITENTTGAPITRHRHLNCSYSAVLYFDKVDKENHPNLTIENPIQTIWGDIFTPSETGANIFNTYTFEAPLDEGTLIMFPSYCYHFHGYSQSLINRRSLACNFHPIGKYGTHDSSMDTNWLAYDE